MCPVSVLETSSLKPVATGCIWASEEPSEVRETVLLVCSEGLSPGGGRTTAASATISLLPPPPCV